MPRLLVQEAGVNNKPLSGAPNAREHREESPRRTNREEHVDGLDGWNLFLEGVLEIGFGRLALIIGSEIMKQNSQGLPRRLEF